MLALRPLINIKYMILSAAEWLLQETYILIRLIAMTKKI